MQEVATQVLSWLIAVELEQTQSQPDLESQLPGFQLPIQSLNEQLGNQAIAEVLKKAAANGRTVVKDFMVDDCYLIEVLLKDFVTSEIYVFSVCLEFNCI